MGSERVRPGRAGAVLVDRAPAIVSSELHVSIVGETQMPAEIACVRAISR